MFDSELRGMARQEQYKDMVREARDASRAAEARPSSVSSTAKALLLLPVLLVAVIARLISFWANMGHHL